MKVSAFCELAVWYKYVVSGCVRGRFGRMMMMTMMTAMMMMMMMMVMMMMQRWR